MSRHPRRHHASPPLPAHTHRALGDPLYRREALALLHDEAQRLRGLREQHAREQLLQHVVDAVLLQVRQRGGLRVLLAAGLRRRNGDGRCEVCNRCPACPPAQALLRSPSTHHRRLNRLRLQHARGFGADVR